MESAVFPTGDGLVLHGVREVVRVPSPAAGAEWSFTVTGGYYRRLLLASVHLVTSATVANRFSTLTIGDGNTTLWASASTYSYAASIAADISYAPNVTTNTTNINTTRSNVCIPDVWLAPGFTVGSATGNIQVADQYSAITLLFECVEREVLKYITPKLEIDLEV